MTTMMPVFPVKLILLAIPVLIVGALLAAVVGRGLGIMLKKQGMAWALTMVMIYAAVNIGYAKAPVSRTPEPDLPSQTIPPAVSEPATPASSTSFVWDDANVLSDQTIRTLDSRNDRLWDYYGVAIGVATCNYGRDDLYSYAMQCAEEMGLDSYDFIVVLDISGDNYWLVQGAGLVRDFTDDDCADYAWDYMESWFAQGDYDTAVLSLTEALEAWCGAYYG